jgi:hypothetical protein
MGWAGTAVSSRQLSGSSDVRYVVLVLLQNLRHDDRLLLDEVIEERRQQKLANPNDSDDLDRPGSAQRVIEIEPRSQQEVLKGGRA